MNKVILAITWISLISLISSPLQAYSQTVDNDATDNNKFENLFEAKITEIVNGELIIRSYYFATPEEAERFEQMMQNTGDITYYQLEIIGEETIDGKTKLVAKAIPTTFTKYTDKPQKLRPEGYIPYTTPKISQSLQELIDSGIERINTFIILKNAPKYPQMYAEMSTEEKNTIRQERIDQIQALKQDLINFLNENDAQIIDNNKSTNGLTVDVQSSLISELGQRDDILTMTPSGLGSIGSYSIDESRDFSGIENLWYIELIDDNTLNFEITTKIDKPLAIKIPSYIILEQFDIIVNDKVEDYSIAQSSGDSLLLIISQNNDKSNPTKLSAPRQQLKQGVSPSDVECNEGLELIFKSSDNSPACVKPSTAEKLIDRGWAKK